MITPFILVYALFTAAMPRSGGDYVFTSRTLHPFLGWLGSFSLWWAEILFLGINSSWVATVYVSSALSSVGSLMSSNTLAGAGIEASTPVWTFIIGSIVILGIGATIIMGVRTHFAFQTVLWIIGIVGAIVASAAALGTSHSEFVQLFNAYASQYMTSPNPYEEIIKIAQSAGYSTGGFSWWSTLMGTGSLFTAFGYSYFSTYSSGEMKSASSVKVELAAMLIPAWATLALVLATVIPLTSSVGVEFLGGSFWISMISPGSWPLPVAPFLNFYVGLMVKNLLLHTVLALGWISWGVLICAILYMMLTRMLFAWSFDRLIPEWFSKVSSNRHAPINSTVFIMASAEIILLLATIFPSAAMLATIAVYGASAMMTITAFLFVSIAAAVFPYRLRSVYEGSPVSKWKIGRVPLMTVAGIFSAILMIILNYFYYTIPQFGVTDPRVLLFIVGTAVTATIIYVVAWQTRKRQGIDLSLTYREIPPL
jgi:amino acid transporter